MTQPSDSTSVLPSLMARHLDIFMCPGCGGALHQNGDGSGVACSSCLHHFSIDGGIPLLFWPHESETMGGVTQAVKSFYEQTPFPNYEDGDTALTLAAKAEKGVFAPLLNQQIPQGSRILEAGCGTGQMSNYLGIKGGRTVYATDMTLNSLKLGHDFRERNQLDNVAFFQMNLLKPVFRPESFDFVICNGVLHHTSDPFGGFQSLACLVEKNGFIIIGLYNKLGRVATNIRRLTFKLFGRSLWFLDRRIRSGELGDNRKNTWYLDQYRNPHESAHTIGEVLGWFDRCGFEFVNSIPKSAGGEAISREGHLFQSNPRGTPVNHLRVQLGLMMAGIKSSGFFVMIGRKRA